MKYGSWAIAPKRSYLNVWGGKALVKRDTLTNSDNVILDLLDLKESGSVDGRFELIQEKIQILYLDMCIVLNGWCVDGKSTKTKVFLHSSTDAEYIAAFDASKEAVWIVNSFMAWHCVPH
ncbi:hypothetical protein Tco_1465687 [Tanacetum coccineum]